MISTLMFGWVVLNSSTSTRIESASRFGVSPGCVGAPYPCHRMMCSTPVAPFPPGLSPPSPPPVHAMATNATTTINGNHVLFTVHLQGRSRQHHRSRQMARMIGIQAPELGQGHRGSLHLDQLGHGIEPAGDDRGPGRRDVLQQVAVHLTENPDDGTGTCQADRAVPILHGRIGLGERATCLAHLQGRLVRQTDRPSRTEKYVMVVVLGLHEKSSPKRHLRVGHGVSEVLAEVR